MKRQQFTLIELLVTIAILVILAGILVPAVNSAVKKGESAKAKAEITALVNAVKQYENTYNKLPFVGGIVQDSYNTDIDGVDEIIIAYATGCKLPKELVKVLQGDDTILNTVSKKANPRKIKFLDITSAGKGEYPDPWDNEYRIILSNDEEIALTALYLGNDDTEMTDSKKRKKYETNGMIYQSVVVWSAGPDGKWSTKDDVHSFNAEYDGGKWSVAN